jgi:predicted tellurium resistance membrane protein TerC
VPEITSSDLITIALLVVLEGILSADNAMVLAIRVLSLPKDQQTKALRYGMASAFTFRAAATAAAADLIARGWV